MKKKDIYLIVSIVLLAIIAFIGIKLTQKEGKRVVITVDGEIYQEATIDEEKEIEVKTDHGVNVVQIHEGQVSMIEADCPDQVCVKHSKISKSGETIVCLPHKVVVEITGEEKELDSLVQ